ncbi:Ppp1r12c [Symbiodinium sp. CCMP2592]|nr:Ppp1r12c [Symbiodinium sp. CCMP2592]
MLSVRHRDDELPNDMFGFRFDANPDHEENEDDESEIRLDGRTGDYRFQYILKEDEYSGLYMVGGQAYDQTGAVVGRMSGALMNQEILGKSFYAACDSVSQELMECSVNLFDSKGRPKASWKAKLREEFAQKGRGGWLYLDEVHLLPSHRGRDLGLDFVECLFNELRGADMCTLAVLEPFGAPARGVKPRAITTSHHDEELGTAANVKLARHFARMGFQQVGGAEPLSNYWFICLCIRQRGFTSKAAAAVVEVSVPPKEPTPKVLTGKDKELFDACTLSMTPPLPDKIQDLLRSGADPNNACALHACAANHHVAAGRMLLEMGCAVNQLDSHGYTPLHLAAAKCTCQSSLDFVSMLLAHGAQKDITTSKGQTPVQCASEADESMKTFLKWERSMIGSTVPNRPETNFAKKCKRLLEAFVPQPVSKRPRLQ